MVSQNPVINPDITGRDRGFVSSQETVYAASPGFGRPIMAYRPFWGPVFAGSFFVISIFALSWYLMLGCHVGIARTGALALGWGSAVWIWVTACIAYFCGGMIAKSIAPDDTGWLKGAVVWGVSLPMALVIYAFSTRTGILVGDLALPHAGLMETANANLGNTMVDYGYFWAAFITLGLGLVSALIGGNSARADEFSNRVTAPMTATEAR